MKVTTVHVAPKNLATKQTVSRAEAMRRTVQRRREAGKLESGWIGLARLVRKDLDDGVPAALGLTAADWLTKTFAASLARIKRARRIEMALSAVPTEKLKRLPEGNAYELTRLPEKQRKAPEWVDKAVKLPVADFKEEVAVAREKLTGMPREKFKTWWVSLPLDLHKRWSEVFERIATEVLHLSTDTPGYGITVVEALTGMLADMPAERLVVEIEGAYQKEAK